MTTQTAELIATAKSLPVEARAEIVDSLLESMRPIEPEIDEAWRAEIDRRTARYEAGESKLIPGEEVFETVRKRFGW